MILPQTPLTRLLVAVALVVALLHGGPAMADEPAETGGNSDAAAAFEPSDEVRQTLLPLFSSIKKADVSRVTVQLTADSLLDGSVVDSQESTYQIASASPNRYTVYLKEPDQRTRVYCDGKSMSVAMAPDAYFRLPDVIGLRQAVTDLPVPLGPYPEAVLALSLAGADPSLTFFEGMKSLELVDRGKFRGKVPAVHFHGVQDDNVSWDFWITQEKEPKPLRLLVDLTPMLRAAGQVQISEGFSYLLRFDFLRWRVNGKVDGQLFEFSPPAGATSYKSLDDYYQQIAGAVAEHRLLGKKAPEFEAQTLAEQAVTSKQLTGKVVVVDFWATWCVPCSSVIPVLQEVTDKFRDQGVVFLAVNVGEDPNLIKGFLKEQEWDLNVVVDADTRLSTAFAAEAIPLTMVIGKTGVVESVHVGFPGPEALRKRLSDELEVLTAGGRIASATDEEK